MPPFAQLLDAAERAGGHRPLVTYSDLDSGERTELGVAAAANWVRKTANLLMDELGAGPGTLIGVRPFQHWTAPVLAMASWAVGAGVAVDEQGALSLGYADGVLSFPDELDAPDPDPTAWALRHADGDLRHADLFHVPDEPLGRVLLEAQPFTPAWCQAVARAVTTGGSLVLVLGGDDAARARVMEQERVDGRLGQSRRYRTP